MFFLSKYLAGYIAAAHAQYNLIKNSQAVKKGAAPKKAMVKKDVKSKVAANQAAQNSPELSLLKFLSLTYHHSHFLAATLDFTSFFTMAFLGAAPFFTAWLFLIRYHFFMYLYTAKPANDWLWGFFNPCVFFFTTGRRKELKEDF